MKPESFQSRLQRIYSSEESFCEDQASLGKRIPTPKQIKEIIDNFCETNADNPSSQEKLVDD